MARIVAYLLLTKNGPDEEAQMAAISGRVPGLAKRAIYCDDVSASRRPEERKFEERALLQDQLRPGDIVAVATPGRLGVGRDDIRGVLHALNRLGGSVLDTSTGKRIVWTDEMADALAFLDRATVEHQADTLRAARAVRKALGIVIRSEPKPFAVSYDEALRVWRDTVRYTDSDAASIIGVSKRTLYNRLGGRHDVGEPPMKRRRRK